MFVNRVLGDAETDTQFDIQITALDGKSSELVMHFALAKES